MTIPRKLAFTYIYRARQFSAALLGRVSSADMREARVVLGPGLYPLFARMPGQYRHHMLAVYRRARESGCRDHDLFVAALLHDTGKFDPVTGRYVSLLYRVAIVLLEFTKPGRGLLHFLAYGRGTLPAQDWRYPFYLSLRHTELGAALVAGRGANQNVVRLVADHHKPAHDDEGLLALQAADDNS